MDVNEIIAAAETIEKAAERLRDQQVPQQQVREATAAWLDLAAWQARRMWGNMSPFLVEHLTRARALATTILEADDA